MLKQLLGKALSLRGTRSTTPSSPSQLKEKRPLVANIDANLEALREIFDRSSDITFRELRLNLPTPVRAFIIFADSLCDTAVINEFILKTIMQETLPSETKNTKANLPQLIIDWLLTNFKAQTESDVLKLVDFVLEGHLALVIDGYPTAIVAAVQGYDERIVNEPSTEPNVRGPKDAFIENLTTNISLLRRRIRTSRLKTETLVIGKLSRTKVAVCYIDGIVNDKIVGEVKARLQKIKTDSILDSGYIQEFISDEPFSLFPLVQYTERPDRTAAALFDGRIAIIVDNSPSTLIVPCTVVALLQASEDYYNAAIFATITRLGRFISLNIALLLPALTISGFAFNLEFIPPSFINTIAGSREGLPFPIAIEVMLMELAFRGGWSSFA